MTPNHDELANAFLRWPLPHSVCADLCATKQGPGRVGTNLLSFVEARQMFRDLLPATPQTSDQLKLVQLCKDLFAELSKENASTDKAWKILQALRSLSDAQGMVIPLEAFEAMGAELRMCAFDTFLGIMAKNLSEVTRPPHS